MLFVVSLGSVASVADIPGLRGVRHALFAALATGPKVFVRDGAHSLCSSRNPTSLFVTELCKYIKRPKKQII